MFVKNGPVLENIKPRLYVINLTPLVYKKSSFLPFNFFNEIDWWNEKKNSVQADWLWNTGKGGVNYTDGLKKRYKIYDKFEENKISDACIPINKNR